MVLSTTKRTASMDSIVNRNQGGGSKKAGLPRLVGGDYHFPIALRVAGTRNTQANYGAPLVMGLKHTRNPNVMQSRPIGSSYRPNTYFKFV
jgi:hypothetical protein